MPKKFGINTKSSESKARKAEVKNVKNEVEKKKKAELEWADSDKTLEAKEEKKRELAEKKQKEKERKEENKRLAEEEANMFAKKTTKSAQNPKISRAQIEAARLAAIANMQAQLKKEEEEKVQELEANLHEDINPNHILRNERLLLEQKGAVLIESSGFDETLTQIEEEKQFKHPEKKVKQAWNDFIEANMPMYKRENPGLKRSQLLDVMHKDFEKSEKNPFNKAFVEYNAKIN